MPIEIRELHINVAVSSPGQNQPRGGAQISEALANSAPDNNREDIIAACVEKVMEILQNKTER